MEEDECREHGRDTHVGKWDRLPVGDQEFHLLSREHRLGDPEHPIRNVGCIDTIKMVREVKRDSAGAATDLEAARWLETVCPPVVQIFGPVLGTDGVEVLGTPGVLLV